MSGATDAARASLIEETLDRAGERVPQFERRVFDRLMELSPQFEPLFALDRDWGVRGSMVQTCIDCILDHLAGGKTGARLIHAERLNHDNLGVPVERFGDLFVAIRDCVRTGAAGDWTPDMEAAWTRLLGELDAVGR